jgi:hypothetical protein
MGWEGKYIGRVVFCCFEIQASHYTKVFPCATINTYIHTYLIWSTIQQSQHFVSLLRNNHPTRPNPTQPDISNILREHIQPQSPQQPRAFESRKTYKILTNRHPTYPVHHGLSRFQTPFRLRLPTTHAPDSASNSEEQESPSLRWNGYQWVWGGR